MTKAQMLMFCAACLLLSFGAGAILYPYATISPQALAASKKPQPMQNLPDVDLGPNYGVVPVTELVGYYIEHPPAPPGSGAPRHQEQFGGC